MCLYVISQKFGHFYSNFFVSLSQKLLTKKVGFCHFLKKIIILSKIWYQKWILWLISIQEMYTFIHFSNNLKVTTLDMFQKKIGFTSLKRGKCYNISR